MDIRARLQAFMQVLGWSKYRLSKESGLSESTIANIFYRNAMPSLTTLEAICRSFGITVSQFLAEEEMVELTPQLKELFNGWARLTPEQKQTVLLIIATSAKR